MWLSDCTRKELVEREREWVEDQDWEGDDSRLVDPDQVWQDAIAETLNEPPRIGDEDWGRKADAFGWFDQGAPVHYGAPAADAPDKPTVGSWARTKTDHPLLIATDQQK
jgi:hypothetical protein